MYTLGKDKLLDEEVLTNVATSSPMHYYVLAGWFMCLSIWVLAFYIDFRERATSGDANTSDISRRDVWQRIFARMVVCDGRQY